MGLNFLLSIDFWVQVAIAAALIVIFVTLFRFLRNQQGNKPGTDAIIQALLPFVQRAIFAGEHLARLSLERVGQALDAADRKQIADSIYDTLPPILPLGPILIPISFVKYAVTRERFEIIVEDEYKAAKAFVLEKQKWLEDQVEALQPSPGAA